MIFGCKSKVGLHEVVNFDEGNKASDEVYIKFLSEQIDHYPGEEDNYIKLATIYTHQNNTTKAKNLLQRAEVENPENLTILIHLAALYLNDEDIENLSASLKTIRNKDPDNMDFLKLSAGYSLLLKDYTNAIFFANRAILANPYDDENFFLRGSAQLINRDSLSALISFEEAYKFKNSYKNLSGVFDVALAVGDKLKAKAYLEEYTSNNSNEQLCYEWGAYFREIGALDTSRYLLENCLNYKPDESRINFELAKIYYQQNNVDSALHYVNNYLGSKPKGTANTFLARPSLILIAIS